MIKLKLLSFSSIRKWNIMFEYENTVHVLIKSGNFIDSNLLEIIELKKEKISELNRTKN